MPATDEDLEAQLGAYAAELDRSSVTMDGPAIRGLVDHDSGAPWKGRSLIAAAAAVLLVGLVGSVAARVFDSDVATSASASSSTRPATAVSDVDRANRPSPSGEDATSSSRPSASGIPFPVKPSDLGPAAARYLPPVDAGYVVKTAQQLEPFSNELLPDGVERVQLDTVPSVDPADHRAVIIAALTFTNATLADDAITAVPELEGSSTLAVGDRTGRWREAGETWAPYGDNTDPMVLSIARVRFDEQTIIDISTLDVAREEVETLIGAAEQSADGSIIYPQLPQGFSSGLSTTVAGLQPGPLPFLRSNVDILEVGLWHENSGAALTIRSFIPRSDDYRVDEPTRNVQTLEIDGVTSFRWVEYSLFREFTLTWVLPDVVIELTDSSGELSIEELLAVADSLESVDDESTWAERLRRAYLNYVPSGPPTPD